MTQVAGATALLVGTVFGCGDAEMDPLAKSLSLYDEGRVQMKEGAFVDAAHSFHQARALDANSPALTAWEARALEQAGDAEAAEEILSGGLHRWRGHSDLRYNRAALRARTLNLEGAAQDLALLYSIGAVDPFVVADDGDFASMANDPNTAALVPKREVKVSMRSELGAVMLGETFDLELQVAGSPGSDFSIRDLGANNGLLALERVVEDKSSSSQWEEAIVQIVYRTLTDGAMKGGPIEVTDGASVALTDPFEIEVVALAERTTRNAEARVPLVLPSGIIEENEPPWVGSWNGFPVFVFGPDMSPEVQWENGEIDVDRPVNMEFRRSGRTEWLAQVWPTSASGSGTVVSEGEVVASGSWK